MTIQWSAMACSRKIVFTRNFSAASSLFLCSCKTIKKSLPQLGPLLRQLFLWKNAFGTSAFGINCSLRKFCQRDALLQKFSAFLFFPSNKLRIIFHCLAGFEVWSANIFCCRGLLRWEKNEAWVQVWLHGTRQRYSVVCCQQGSLII